MIVAGDELELAARYRAVLEPISLEAPAGDYVRYTPAWDKLREIWLFNYKERLPEEGLENAPAWEDVQRYALALITEQSKDLQAAIWFAYASVRSEGFAGLADGLFLIRQLIALFGNHGLHPDDPDDPEVRLALLDWFDSQLASSLPSLPATPVLDGLRLSVAEYESFSAPLLNPDPSLEEAAGRARAAQLSQGRVQAANGDFFLELYRAAQSGAVQLSRLIEAAGFEFPLTSQALERCLGPIRRWAEAVPVKAPVPSPEAVRAAARAAYLAKRYEKMLAPIAPSAPAGEPLWQSSDRDWDTLRHARQGIRGGLLAAIDSMLEPPDWKLVAQLAGALLERRAKDLQVAMWLALALLEDRGPEGLSEGLYLIAGLVERFWDTLFPQDPEDREELVQWFDDELAEAILAVPLLPSPDGSGLSYRQCKVALDSLSPETAHPDRGAAAEFGRALAAMTPKDHQVLADALGEASRWVDRLESFRLHSTAGSLDSCRKAAAKWAKLDPAALQPVPDAEDPESIPDLWQRALAYIRLGDCSQASPLLEQTLTGLRRERDRFCHKLELAETLVAAGRHEWAAGILTALDEQVEGFRLREWEGPEIAGRVWSALLECCHASSDADLARVVERKIGAAMPWRQLR